MNQESKDSVIFEGNMANNDDVKNFSNKNTDVTVTHLQTDIQENLPFSVWDDGVLTDFLETKNDDPWVESKFKGYIYLTPKQKGNFGECFVERYAKLHRHEVVRPTTPSNGPYDRIIGGYKTEIKFSLTMGKKKPNRFIINHVARGKDWDRLIFVCINGPSDSEWEIKWFNKEDFINHLELLGSEECLFRRQQGGSKGGNDDFMCSGKNPEQLISQSWVHSFSEW